MEIDTSNLTDSQISKLNKLIHSMEKENKTIKWWIIPKFSCLDAPSSYEEFGPCYYVEPEQDRYSKSKPPLKSGFNSKKEAEDWLENYLREKAKFNVATNDLNDLISNLGIIREKLAKREYIRTADWNKCFSSFTESMDHGLLREVTKE